jgi:rubrerythrin
VTRILLLVALGLFVLLTLRRALAAGRTNAEPTRRSRGSGAPRRPLRERSADSPGQLVCGACGEQFDPEESGWICPSCGK